MNDWVFTGLLLYPDSSLSLASLSQSSSTNTEPKSEPSVNTLRKPNEP